MVSIAIGNKVDVYSLAKHFDNSILIRFKFIFIPAFPAGKLENTEELQGPIMYAWLAPWYK